MTIRVALVGTGNAGRLALTQLIDDDRFDLVGVCVNNPDKVGVDAGILAGGDSATGVVAVGDLESIIEGSPDVVVYCAMGDTRPIEAFNDILAIVSAGIDVVGSAPGGLQYPWGVMPDKAIAKLEKAAHDLSLIHI